MLEPTDSDRERAYAQLREVRQEYLDMLPGDPGERDCFARLQAARRRFSDMGGLRWLDDRRRGRIP
jgi:hypothetical protein